MQQVADISMAAILKELRLDESEYADMLATQTKMIDQLNKQVAYSKQILRIILRENIDLRDILQEHGITEGFKLIDLDSLLFNFDGALDDGEES